jgi:hypothetical protein
MRWRLMEKVYDFVNPGGYADEHITHYNAAMLEAMVEEAGFEVTGKRYVGGGELILRCRRSS